MIWWLVGVFFAGFFVHEAIVRQEMNARIDAQILDRERYFIRDLNAKVHPGERVW